MSLNIKREVIRRGVTVFQTVLENAQGGFVLDVTGLAADAVLPAGTVIGYDEATRKAVVLKSATLQADATNADTGYKVIKGHVFKVGDVVAAKLKDKAYTITAIDTTNGAYDVITLNTTLGSALTAGTALFQANSEVATTSAFKTAPKGLLYEDTKVEANADLAVVIRGTIYARRAPGAAADVKAAMPNIIFSQSY